MNRKRPGELAGWAVALIIAACCVTFAGVALGVDLVYGMIDPAVVKRGWVPYALTYVTAFCVLVAWLPPARLSRALRVAVLLPAVHAFVIGLAWPAWHALSRFFTNHTSTSELVTRFPLAAVVGASLVGFLGFALIVARRRSGEWQHGFVMLALSELLLLGLWLPISIAIDPGGGDWWSSGQPLVDDALGRALFTVIPPTVIAATFAAAGMLQPARLLAARSRIIGFVGALFAIALVTRADASAREMLLYSNLLPLLFAAMFVAIAALVLFGIALALRSYRAHRAFTKQRSSDGVIVLDDDQAPVAGFEITSWLRGPRVLQRPFAVSIAGGTIPVRGAHIVAALPAATTQLEIGEAYAALRPGDRVRIAGHSAAGGDPFRTSAAPLAGELFVAPFERASSGFTHVALAMWRPCVAYLLIVVAIALPALAAFAAT
ncbi:MAG TPA: hypothetical protein VIV11_05035 [Kofleriaceae bacterium]